MAPPGSKEINHFLPPFTYRRMARISCFYGKGSRRFWLTLLQRLIGVLEHQLVPGLINLQNYFDAFFPSLGQVVALASDYSPEEESKKRFTTNLLLEPALEKQVNRLQEELNNWTTQLSRFVDELEDEEEFREDFYFLAETGLFFTKVAALLPRILDGGDERYVSWLNIAQTGEDNMSIPP